MLEIGKCKDLSKSDQGWMVQLVFHKSCEVLYRFQEIKGRKASKYATKGFCIRCISVSTGPQSRGRKWSRFLHYMMWTAVCAHSLNRIICFATKNTWMRSWPFRSESDHTSVY